MISIDHDLCRKMGEKLRQLTVHADYFIPRVKHTGGQELEANFWFFIIGICQYTKSLKGIINGKFFRGADYLIHAGQRKLKEDPAFYLPENISRLTEKEFKALFSDDFNPDTSTIDRIEERMALLQDMAEKMQTRYGTTIMKLYEESQGYLRGEKGIITALKQFEAYSDPVEKKSFLLAMFLDRLSIWPVIDPENLCLAVDYHIMRVILRTGALQFPDNRIPQILKNRDQVGEDIDVSIRQAVLRACQSIIEASGISWFNLDCILWMIGRNCCFYDHEPICGFTVCHKFDKCSLIQSIDYACPKKCPLDRLCRGSQDKEYRALSETNFPTHYY